jgi:hypothetical protein
LLDTRASIATLAAQIGLVPGAQHRHHAAGPLSARVHQLELQSEEFSARIGSQYCRVDAFLHPAGVAGGAAEAEEPAQPKAPAGSGAMRAEVERLAREMVLTRDATEPHAAMGRESTAGLRAQLDVAQGLTRPAAGSADATQAALSASKFGPGPLPAAATSATHPERVGEEAASRFGSSLTWASLAAVIGSPCPLARSGGEALGVSLAGLAAAAVQALQRRNSKLRAPGRGPGHGYRGSGIRLGDHGDGSPGPGQALVDQLDACMTKVRRTHAAARTHLSPMTAGHCDGS